MNRRPIRKRRLSIQTLEARRVLAASLGWDGPGLGDATLTYHIANSPSSLSQSEVNAAVETALDAWSDVIDVTFVPTSQSGLRDSLDIRFTSIDGRGGTLAQAYFPDDVNPARIAGDIEFDSSENWEIGNGRGRSAFDLVWVAAHEIGHALGLDHLDVSGTVLAPFVSPNTQFTELSAADISAARSVYAPAPTTTTTVDDQVDTTVNTTTNTNTDDSSGTDTTDDTSSDDTPEDNDRRNRRFRWWFWSRWAGFFGGRLEADAPQHHNANNATDVNGDNRTTGADALMIINQIRQMLSGASADVEGMCDTNADGDITVSDALYVINMISQAGQDNSAGGEETADEADEDPSLLDDVTIVVDTEDPTDSSDQTATEEPVDDADGDGDVDNSDETPVDEAEDEQEEETEGDDTEEEFDEDETDDPIDQLDDTVDPNDQTDENDEEETDEVDDDEVDQTDDDETEEDEVDDTEEPDEEEEDEGDEDENDGEMSDDSDDNSEEDDLDDTEDSDDEEEMDEESEEDSGNESDEENEMDEQDDCPEGHRHGHHFRRGFRLLRDPEALFDRFDDNDDGGISEDEVPAFLWDKLIERGIDTSGDNIISLEEVEAAIAAARAEKFARRDANGDGLLQEEEVGQRRWQRIMEADTNGDGGVSMEELNAWKETRQMEQEQEMPMPAPVDQIFTQIGRARRFGFARGF